MTIGWYYINYDRFLFCDFSIRFNLCVSTLNFPFSALMHKNKDQKSLKKDPHGLNPEQKDKTYTLFMLSWFRVALVKEST